MIGSGGGIYAHPCRPISGVRAFRQVFDAAMNRIPCKVYAYKELAEYLGLFGFKKTKFTSV